MERYISCHIMIIIYSLVCYFSSLEHIAYDTKSKNTVDTILHSKTTKSNQLLHPRVREKEKKKKVTMKSYLHIPHKVLRFACPDITSVVDWALRRRKIKYLSTNPEGRVGFLMSPPWLEYQGCQFQPTFLYLFYSSG